MRDALQHTPHRPRPTVKDWLLLAINIVFVVMGLIILPHERDGGIVTIAFFGSCLAVAAGTVLRKLRYRRFSAERVTVAGGVPIRPSSYVLPLLGAWMLGLGVVLFVFGHDYPFLFRAIGVFVAVVGVALLALAVTGRVPGGFLQFDPEGLTIAERGWRARIPWENIAAVHEGDMNSNPLLLVTVADPTRLEIAPPGAHERTLRRMRSTRAMMGADFAILTRHYGIDLPVLAGAVARYAYDVHARADLRPRLT